MRLGFIALLIMICGVTASHGQCLTSFQNVFPDRTLNYKEAFGQSVSVYDNILAIGAPQSDSLGFEGAGIVYLYQKLGEFWQPVGVLKPSVVNSQKGFGITVLVTMNYILVGCTAYNSGVYIFRKPITGWSTATETALLKPVSGVGFGSFFDISGDEQTIAVTDIGYSNGSGSFFVFHKETGDEWINSSPSQIIINPDKNNNVNYFGIGGVKINNNRIACATVAAFSSSVGSVYMFKDESGTFANFQYEAKLTESSTSTGSYGPAFEFTSEGVFKYIDGKVLFYKTPVSGSWPGGDATCSFSIAPIDGLVIEKFYVNYNVSGSKLYFSVKLQDGSGRILTISKSGSEWCSGISQKVIYNEPPLQAGGSQLFVRSFSCFNQTEIACSWISSNESGSLSAVAVGVFSIQPDNSLTKQTILKNKKDAVNSNLGTALYHTGDFLFSSAINERILDVQPRGAVYVFKKTGTNWNKVTKLSSPPVNDSDRGFGGFVTGYSDYLAISAFGYTPSGIFIYKGNNGDFANPSLVQRLTMPSGQSVDSYGNPVINNDWIIVPSLRNTSAGYAGSLFFFKKDKAGQWAFNFTMDLPGALGNIVFKQPPTIDLREGTLIASNGYDKVFVIEFNTITQAWTNNNTLYASDADKDPFIGTLTVNGSFFGSSLKLTDKAIFVGAPGKNYNSSLDVGAIYVFLRDVNDSWTSGIENEKILPMNKTSGTFFGTSIDVLQNTLITGAVSTSKPGKVFVIQSQDYKWKNTIPLLELTGTSTSIDYFGYAVGLDGDNFFISANKENNILGIGAGTIYITTPPPSIKLESPVCDSSLPFYLKGYPVDGTWSGPGITNGNNGTFDPAKAGTGIHFLTYKTPNCFYTGKLQIEVVNGPKGQITGILDNVICQKGKTTVNLAVQEEQNATYKWYYRANVSDTYVPTTDLTPKIVVSNSKPGQYQINIGILNCTVVHEFNVAVESLKIITNPVSDICDRATDKIILGSNYPGGSWNISGSVVVPGIIDQNTSTLFVSKLPQGIYTATYDYISSSGCSYSSSQQFSIDLLTKPGIHSSGDLCSGSVQITVDNIDQKTIIEWFKDNLRSALPASTSVKVITEGDYFIKVSKGACTDESDMIHIEDPRDSLFVPNVITPNGDSYNDDLRVSGQNLNDFYMVLVNRDGAPIFSTNDAAFKWDADGISTGTYFWYASYSNCSNNLLTQKGWLSILR